MSESHNFKIITHVINRLFGNWPIIIVHASLFPNQSLDFKYTIHSNKKLSYTASLCLQLQCRATVMFRGVCIQSCPSMSWHNAKCGFWPMKPSKSWDPIRSFLHLISLGEDFFLVSPPSRSCLVKSRERAFSLATTRP